MALHTHMWSHAECPFARTPVIIHGPPALLLIQLLMCCMSLLCLAAGDEGFHSSCILNTSLCMRTRRPVTRLAAAVRVDADKEQDSISMLCIPKSEPQLR